MKSLTPILVCLLLLTTWKAQSQCSTTPVIEAVRNGNFELGYLPGSTIGSAVASHTFTPGGDFDFFSNLSYSGQWKSGNGPCLYGMANQYGVGRVENPACKFGGKQIVYGQYAGPNTYKDHTLGTNKGFALFIDFHQNPGTFKVVWGQEVDVFPSQLYYFSSWFAQYGGNQAKPTLRFRVQTFDASGNLIENKIVGSAPVSPPAMNWQQFNGAYSTPANAVTAKIFIECKPTGTPNQDDFMIDDISFINGCQNIESQIAYTVDFADDAASLCYNDGSYTAQILKDNGNNLGSGKTITWYEGSGASQTEIPAFSNQQAPTLTTTGTYRACVTDPVNSGCTVNATIKINKNISVDLPDNIDLCSPAQVTLNDGRTETGLTHSWGVPPGATASTTNTQVAALQGNYSVTVALPSIPGCSASDNTNVTSSLPNTTLDDYCIGDPVKLGVGSGKWLWMEDDKTTVIGTESGGTPVTWASAPNTPGNYSVSLVDASTNPLSTIVNQNWSFEGDGTAMTIKVFKPVVLKSAQVRLAGWAGTKNVAIKIGGSMTKTITRSVNGIKTINLDLALPIGTYTIQYNAGGEYMVNNPSGNIPGYVTVSGNGGKGSLRALKFESANACDPVLVDITAKNCCVEPEITTQPSNRTACAGLIRTFSVATSAANPSYQWEVSHDGGTTWALVSGSEYAGKNTANLKVSASSGLNNIQVRAIVTAAGCPKYSNSATLTVHDVPSISNSLFSEMICSGSSSSGFNLSADLSNTTFNWTSNAVGVSGESANGNGNIPAETLSGNGTVIYSVTPTGPAPGNCSGEATDFTITVNENPATPTITATPAATAICEGEDITLTASSTTSGSNFSWSKGVSSGVNDQKIVISGASTSDAGSYAVTASSTSSGLTCTSETSESYGLTVNMNPTITISNPSPQCGGSYDLSDAVSGTGSATLSYWDAAANGNIISNPVTATGTNTFFIEASENGCTSTRKSVQVTIDESVNLTAASPSAVCSPNTIDITSNATPAQAVIAYYNAAGGSNGSGAATSPTGIGASGTYSVEAVNGSCTESADINVVINPLPTGEIGIDKSSICNDGVDQATITITAADGNGPYDINYTQGGVPVQVTGVVSQEVTSTMSEESFVLTGITDSKGCAASDLGNPATVSTTFKSEPKVTQQSFECKPSNPVDGAPGVYEYRLILTASDGDVSSYDVSGTFGGSSVNGSFSGNTWTSEWITENSGDRFELDFTDINGCNPASISADTVCSCSEAATLAITSGSPATVCPQGEVTSSDITITFDDGGTGANSYNFDIYKDGTSIQSITNHDGSPFSLSDQSPGEYTVVGLVGTCSGASNSIAIEAYESPTGTITAIDDTLCSGVNNAEIQLAGGYGSAPWIFTVSGATYSVAPLASIMPSIGGEFTITEIKDDNGCIATDLAGLSVTIGEVASPSGAISLPETIVTGTSGSHTFNPTSLSISASTPAAGYQGHWEVTPVTGQASLGSGPSMTNNTIEGMNFDDEAIVTWTIVDNGFECPAATATLNIVRKNITIASVQGDKLCRDFNGYTLTGNGLVPGETATWRLSPLSSVSGLTISSVGGSDGRKATVTGYVLPVGVASEDVIFEYEVTPVVGPPTTDTMTVTIYAPPIANPGTNETICGNSYQLNADPIEIGTGQWTDNNGSITYDDPSLHNATANNLPSGSPGNPVQVEFTFAVSNGVCPTESNSVTITRSGDLTDPSPTVSANEICISGASVSLDGASPESANSETSLWSVSPSSNVSLVSTANEPVANATFDAVGTYIFTYTMDNPTCPQTDKTVTVEVKDTASISGITYTDGCQNTTVTATVTGGLNVESTSWFVQNGATLSNATETNAAFILGSNQSTSTISAFPYNSVCGAGSIHQISNNVNLVPQVQPEFESGSTLVCSSSSSETYQISSSETPAPTSYIWKWDTDIKAETGSTLELTSSDFSGLNESQLSVTAVNSCGSGASSEITVYITSADPIDVTLSSDKTDNKFCEGDDIVFTASSSNGSIGGLSPDYRFLLNGSEIQAASPSSTFISSDLLDGDLISVEITGASGGCYTTSTASTSIMVDGYRNPIASMTLGANGPNGICSGEGKLTATIIDLQKGDLISSWTHTNGSSNTTLLAETAGSITQTFTEANEDGYYQSIISNSVCPNTIEAGADVQIWSHSDISFDDNGFNNGNLLLDLTEGTSITVEVPISIISNGGRATAGESTWTVDQSSIDLTGSNEALLVVQTEYETNGTAYATLTFEKGVCVDEINIPILASFGLAIPNAFTPNGDGLHDVWEIKGYNSHPYMQIKLFNRWGTKVYEVLEGYNASDAWDGDNLPSGTYYYVITLNDDLSKAPKDRETIKGNVSIIR